MALFFVKILSHNNEISVPKAKCFIAINVIVIVITLFRYYVHGQLFTTIEMIDEDMPEIFFSSSVNMAFVRITRYISQVCPFMIASSLVYMLTFFAQGVSSKDETSGINDDNTEIANQQLESEIVVESLRGSIGQQNESLPKVTSEILDSQEPLTHSAQNKDHLNLSMDATYRLGRDYGFSYKRVKYINKEFKRRHRLMADPYVNNKQIYKQ